MRAMKQILLMAALLAACGGSDDPKPDAADPHAAATCGSSWDPMITPSIAGMTCESACAEYTPASGSGCTTTCTLTGGQTAVCSDTFESDGVRGCCLNQCGSDRLNFAECQ